MSVLTFTDSHSIHGTGRGRFNAPTFERVTTMGWELKSKPQTLRITKRLAQEFAEMDAAHVDRPLSERRLSVYRKVRQDGGFRPVTWAKAWCEETGQYYRVNGKHTSTLFSDGDNPENLFVTIEDYKCDTLEDVAKLYATFDSQSQTRTTADINRSFAAVIPELKDYDTRFLNLVVSGLNMSPTDPENWKGTAAERAESMFDNVEIITWVKSLVIDRGKHPALWRVPVVGAMIGCYRKAKAPATTFWTAVRDETGEKPNLPDRKLAKFLTTTVSKVGAHNTGPQRYRITGREYFTHCVKCWNAWRKGEVVDMLKYSPQYKIPAFS